MIKRKASKAHHVTCQTSCFVTPQTGGCQSRANYHDNFDIVYIVLNISAKKIISQNIKPQRST